MGNVSAKLADKVANRRYYFIDNGILNLFVVDPLTALPENQVAIQLRRQYGDEVYFFHEGVEVDFYVPEVELAVQVCYSLEDESTRRREVGALLKMAARVEVKRMLVITRDEEETINEEGWEIAVVPVWKWLLENRMEPVNG
jgi:predicted AAA+ superfamily ATPase